LANADNTGYTKNATTLSAAIGTGILIILFQPSSERVPVFSKLLGVALMLLCAVLNVSVDTALLIFRDPSLGCPLGSGAGPILIAGCNGKLNATLAKKAWRLGYDI
jgi:peptidoglycan/LPS O-acetylase OafA/YrhL